MDERRKGFYWIKVDEHRDWDVAKLDSEGRFWMGDAWWTESDFAAIGSRIPAPEEPQRGWILASDHAPENKPGTWSKPVIALTLGGEIFQLTCMNGYWQRPAAMDEHDSVLAWMPIPPMP